MDYERALNYANTAKEIYIYLKNSDSISKTEILIDRITSKDNLSTTPRDDYTSYIIYGAIGVIALLFILSSLKRRRRLAEEGIRL